MFILYVVTFCVILPPLCHMLKYSIYYHNSKNIDSAQDEMRKENDKRIQDAQNFFDMIDKGKLHTLLEQFHGHDNRIDIAISIITVARNKGIGNKYKPKYLTQVVWKFLSLLYKSHGQGYPFRIQLSICNVDSDPDFYQEAKDLSKFIPLLNRFNKRTLNMDHVLEKEKQDYVYCLNTSLHKYQPRYVLLVEDDALPNDDFFDILQYMVQKHLGHDKEHGLELINNKPLVFVKMYHPERLLGFYSIEPERLPELFGFGLLFGTVFLSIYIHFCERNLTKKYVYSIWICFILYFVMVALAVGRQNFVELRRMSKHLYSYVPAPGCCTPAMLFPENGANIVINYLSKVKCRTRFGKDMALDKMRSEQSLSAFMIQPNLFKHIGMYSSLHDIVLDPAIV